MKKIFLLSVIFIVFLFFSCNEENIYQYDPRLGNDLLHGNLTGRVIQKDSQAKITVSQLEPVASTTIDPVDGSFSFENLEVGNYDLTIEANNYRIYKYANVNVNLAGTTYLGEIDLSTVPDLVASHYPEDQDEIVYNNRYSRLTISMTFTRDMDRESVEEAFSTDPPSEGIFFWGTYARSTSEVYFNDAATASWGFDPGATITTYSKITSFSYQMAQKDCFIDTTYHVTLSTAAKDTSGNQLRFPLEFSFKTIQSSSTINGIQTNPYHGDIFVSPLSRYGIQITFPRNMDEQSTEQAITVIPETPAMENIFIWQNYNQLTIYTGGAFLADTSYLVTIDSSAKDRDGITLGQPFSFSFRTAPVMVNGSTPTNGELFVSPYEELTLQFNTYVIKSSVANSFTIEPHVSGSFSWRNNSKTYLDFYPSTALQYNTKYTVTIDSEVEDIFGTKMKEPYSFSFITRPE